MSENPIIVVGAGQAGLQVVDSVRRGGYEGSLVLIGNEDSLPYQRPPLSKQYMSADMADERLLFRPGDYYQKKNVELMLGAEVSELNVQARTLRVDGKTMDYAKLALTTGASVRPLPVPGAGQAGVCYLRSLEDAQNIRAELTSGPRRVVAIGGGFIGLEIAASACELGHSVTVIEAQDRLMARVVAPIVSDYCLKVHRAHGIEVLLNAAVSRIERTDDASLKVVLADESSVPADITVVGIGSIPHVELAEAAELRARIGGAGLRAGVGASVDVGSGISLGARSGGLIYLGQSLTEGSLTTSIAVWSETTLIAEIRM